MRTKFNGILTLILAFVVQASFAQMTITGTVKDDQGPIPGASVMVKGTQNGTVTDFDGHYSISANTGDVLVFSYVGNSTEKTVGTSNVIDAVIGIVEIEGIEVVGVKGIKIKPRETTYASQSLGGDDLGIGKDTNIKTALAGKVAGVQVAAQSGAKLGSAGKVYLRGAISATGRDEALYIVDGIETSADNVDMDNVASINVLKGPAAVGLYGLRGANGVIVITSNSGKKGKVSVSVYNNTTFENVAYLMNYQNEYGQGYSQTWDVHDQAAGAFGYSFLPFPAEWAVLDGKRYKDNYHADESWGPKFDGGQYIPWYAWFPGDADFPNPYYGKTEAYVASPDNVKDYYKTGVTTKTGFSISGGNDTAKGILSYSRTAQDGLLPYTDLTNDNLSAKFDVNLSEKLSIGVIAKYNKKHVNGQVDDTYGTGTSGSFNQWFGRNLDVKKMEELKELKTIEGYSATWNWWGPNRQILYRDYYGYEGANKAVFWLNPYFQQELLETSNTTHRLSGAVNFSYKLNENLKFDLRTSKNGYTYSSIRKTPYILEFNTAYDLYGVYQDSPNINSMSEYNSQLNQIEFNPSATYTTNITDDLDLQVILGGESRTSKYTSQSMSMTNKRKDPSGGDYGLVIPDLFNFANSREKIIPSLTDRQYKVRTVYSRVKFGYKNFLTLTADVSNVWDSRYDILRAGNKNSFMFGTIGTSFVFTDIMKNKGFLDFGKIFLNYATVGTEVGAYELNPTNSLEYAGSSYVYNQNNLPTMYTPTTAANPNVTPATSTAIEGGFTLRMLESKVRFSTTYFDEHRTDEILNTSISNTTGYSRMITNAGDVHRRGVEVELGLKAVNKESFKWNVDFNFARIRSSVISLADGQDGQLMGYSSFGAIKFINIPGEDWGQLQGNAIKRDAAGNPIFNASDEYVTEEVLFGSVLPDFNGGMVNSFSYKGISLAATISFQKGGKFFSLSEYWGTQTGLLEETAGNNDLGNPQRDDVASGGGVHIVGVDELGAPVDKYIDANAYYSQMNGIKLAEPFVHDASYIKLADISISYKIPKSILGNAIQNASIGIIARNLGMIAVSSENKHNWDPSEFAYAWGEDAGLPGTRSIGFNVKLTF